MYSCFTSSNIYRALVLPGSILTLKVHVNQTQVPALPSVCGSEGSREAQREEYSCCLGGASPEASRRRWCFELTLSVCACWGSRAGKQSQASGVAGARLRARKVHRAHSEVAEAAVSMEGRGSKQGWPGARVRQVCSRGGVWFSGKPPSKPGPALQLKALLVVNWKPP